MSNSIDEQMQQAICELELKATNGDADAQHHLFILLRGEAMDKYDLGLFYKADEYLKLAAENGFPDALEDIKHQELRKNALIRRIERRKGITQ